MEHRRLVKRNHIEHKLRQIRRKKEEAGSAPAHVRPIGVYGDAKTQEFLNDTQLKISMQIKERLERQRAKELHLEEERIKDVQERQAHYQKQIDAISKRGLEKWLRV